MSWRHPFGLLAIFAFSVVLGVGPKPAAEPQAPAKDTIKVQAAEVVVDAIVTDKHNRIVTNLSADDFTVYEDGVPQKLTSFRLYQGTPLAKKEERPAPTPSEVVAPPPPAGRRTRHPSRLS